MAGKGLVGQGVEDDLDLMAYGHHAHVGFVQIDLQNRLTQIGQRKQCAATDTLAHLGIDHHHCAVHRGDQEGILQVLFRCFQIELCLHQAKPRLLHFGLGGGDILCGGVVQQVLQILTGFGQLRFSLGDLGLAGALLQLCQALLSLGHFCTRVL